MKILALDTASSIGGVAVWADGMPLAEVQIRVTSSHAKRIMPAVECVLELSGIKFSEIDAYSVTLGPGSFTGVRIGLSTVKGLAFGTNKPVAGVSTLDALAYQLPFVTDWLICPIIDARKGQVFTSLYQGGEGPSWKKIHDECVVAPGQWLSTIMGKCVFVGDGAVAYRAIIEDTLGINAGFAPPYMGAVQASIVAALGARQIELGQTADIASLEPVYLRKPDAELGVGRKILSR